MPAVRFLAGYFGSPDPWASNEFETMEIDDSGGVYEIYGDTHNGAVVFGRGYFGPNPPPPPPP